MRSEAKRLLVVLGIVPALVATAVMSSAEIPNPVDSDGMAVAARVPFDSTQGPGDLAFWGKYAVVGRGLFDGNRKGNGFALVDVSSPRKPKLVSEFTCTNSGFDVSIFEDLVILSRDDPSASADCGSEDVAPGVGYAGLEIVSIADPRDPVPVKSVPTGQCELGGHCASGSHTHTLLPDPQGRRLLAYSNSVPVSIVEIPLEAPEDARVIGHVDAVDGCHDIQVYVPGELALCAGIHSASLLDITEPEDPALITTFKDPVITHHHSAVFSGDGRTLAVSDESVAVGALPFAATLADQAGVAASSVDACQDTPAGQLTFYDIGPTIDSYRTGKPPVPPERLNTFQIPARIAAMTTSMCFGHYATRVPLGPTSDSPITDLLVVGWGAAGTWLIDFSDPQHPRAVGHYVDITAGSADMAASSYWYNGYIYVNHGAAPNHQTDRGFEVLEASPTDPEVREVLQHAPKVRYLQPQTQQ